MLLFIPVIEMIPNTALAALLIAVGYRLASPNEFFKTYKIGSEQLVIFVVTIIVTVSTDLLVGVGAGILMKFVFHILNGVSFRNLFKAKYEFSQLGDEYIIKIRESAIFSNLIGFKKVFSTLDHSKKITVDFSEAHLLDHSFMEYLHHLEEECTHAGGSIVSVGFDRFKPFSNHPLAARKFSLDHNNKIEIKLSPRQLELRKFAENNEWTFFPQRVKSSIKYKDFPIQNGNKIPYEDNILGKYVDAGKIESSDITLQEGARQSQNEIHITIIQVAEIDTTVPDFALEPEGLWSKLFESVSGKDIDFDSHPLFSKKYYLRGPNETQVRNFFNESLIQFLENREEMHIECHRNRLIFYKKRDLLEPSEILYVSKFAEEFMSLLHKNEVHIA